MTPETLFASNIVLMILALGLYVQLIILGRVISAGLDRITEELSKMNSAKLPEREPEYDEDDDPDK